MPKPSRRDRTTELIREAAVLEFTSSGARSLSLHQVATRAFVSVGAVYQRWASKDDCVAEIIRDVLPATVSKLTEPWAAGLPIADISHLQLTSSDHLHGLRLLTECLLAARDTESLAPIAIDATQRFTAAVRDRFIPHPHRDSVAWWVVSTWLGHSLLATSGCHLPPGLPATVSTMLDSTMRIVPQSVDDTSTVGGPTAEVRMASFSDDSSLDPLGQGIIESARQSILQRDIEATDVRSIARNQGVTTGAIYRRFAGKSEMLGRVLERELPFNKRTWVQPFIASLTEGGADAAAKVLASVTETVWTDRATAHLLLEFTVAAHDDRTILAKLHQSISQSALEREELFKVLISEGLIRQDLAAEAAAWMLQVPPIGMRILGALNLVPESHGLTALIAGYLRFLVSDSAQDD